MSRNNWPRRVYMTLAVCLILATLGGCALHKLGKTAMRQEQEGNYDQAVLSYAKLAAMQPGVTRWTIDLSRVKFKASQEHFRKGQAYMNKGQIEEAIGEYQQVVILDPTNSYAQTELEKAIQKWQLARLEDEQTEMERMKEQARKSSSVPMLDARSNIPVILQFRDAELGKIYDVLSKATGINFLYDPKLDLRKKVTIELTNVPFEKAMDTLMLTNKHFFKVIDENTILIADDNQQKRREYADEVIQTFFLSNADVKDVQSLLRTMLDARKVVQNEQLNAITIRDTPNKVAIARKIIESNDKAKAELIVDVELLEVNRTVSKTIGIGLTPRQYTVQFEGGDRLSLNNLGLLNQVGLYTLGPIPQVTLDFLKSDSGTRVIAKPQLRVTEGEAANLHIGDSVPIPTTTFNTTTSVGGGVVPITSFTYQEVGIVIEIEPRVHHNKEVTLKLNVEVSALGDQVDAGQGVSQPSINTRQISTVIRLKDGESSLLAGLIGETSTASRSGYPGLMDIPGINNVFSTRTSTVRENDLILTLTPRIIRIPDVRQQDLEALWIGNEANPKLRGEAGSVFRTPFTAYMEGDDDDAEGDDSDDGAEADGDVVPAATGATSNGTPAPGGTGSMNEAADPARPGGTGPVTAVVPGEGPPVQPGAEAQRDDLDEAVLEQDENEPQLPASIMNLSIAPARLTVAMGGTFSINVLANNVHNMQRLAFTLTYDATTIDFDSALEGIAMKSDGAQTLFTAEKVTDGVVQVQIERLGGESGISQGGALASLRFRALAQGSTRIGFGPTMAEDYEGEGLPLNPKGMEVTVAR